uniref:Uncharacterized protein n=1 Tax=Arundo donax TaxID=35708 RepID=A0A0A8ZMP8_ARUDO
MEPAGGVLGLGIPALVAEHVLNPFGLASFWVVQVVRVFGTRCGDLSGCFAGLLLLLVPSGSEAAVLGAASSWWSCRALGGVITRHINSFVVDRLSWARFHLHQKFCRRYGFHGLGEGQAAALDVVREV